MAFTTFWKIFFIIYLCLTFPFAFQLINFPEKSKIENFKSTMMLPTLIVSFVWLIMTGILFYKVLCTPSSEYIIKTETKKVYEIICDDCDYCNDTYYEYYPEDDEDDDWMYEDIWGY